ncbi:Sugar transporter ERD6-like 6 [Tritrichomonas foetus]|uniref:Sugar transporter ERD6-like 6 n=1 Tax=Tritrichomonas foetus TaxID=1144522 RepID=A0A1J4JQN2_9EUKA|nr:Sugar transporter ERD6-like 6 [Tritrichomonas foetus]|eukprot:OHT01425.1 Sugar transporter ERD6-like 6 [Tritrichomonas foetus]
MIIFIFFSEVLIRFMGNFCQKAFAYVFSLSIGTISVGFGLVYFAASYTTIVDPLILDTSMKQSIFNALTPIGAIFGGPLVNFAIQKFGRKFPTMVSSGFVILGGIFIIITKTSYKELAFVGRAVLGLGVGAVSTVNPVYIAELSPPDVRGSYGVMSQLFCSIGTLMTYFVSIWVDWRAISGIMISFPLLSIISIFFIPESPAFTKMETENKKKQENIFQKKYSLPLILSFFVVVFQQFSGINALFSNLTVIFEKSKVTLNSSISSAIVAIAQIIATASSTPLVECLGRRKTWMISSIGQAIFLLILWANEKWNWSTILPVVMLFFDVFLFGIGLGPIPWFVVPELFPDEVRGLAMGIVQAVNWLLCALMVFIFPTMQENLTLAWTYFFYGVVMVISFLFGIFALPETKGGEMGVVKKNDNPKSIDTNTSSNLEENFDSSRNSQTSSSELDSESYSDDSNSEGRIDEV